MSSYIARAKIQRQESVKTRGEKSLGWLNGGWVRILVLNERISLRNSHRMFCSCTILKMSCLPKDAWQGSYTMTHISIYLASSMNNKYRGSFSEIKALVEQDVWKAAFFFFVFFFFETIKLHIMRATSLVLEVWTVLDNKMLEKMRLNVRSSHWNILRHMREPQLMIGFILNQQNWTGGFFFWKEKGIINKAPFVEFFH